MGHILRFFGHDHRVHRLVLHLQLRMLEAGGAKVFGVFVERECVAAVGVHQHVDGEERALRGPVRLGSITTSRRAIRPRGTNARKTLANNSRLCRREC